MADFNPEELRKDFLEDGFVFLPAFLSPQEVAEVNSVLNKFIQERAPSLPAEHAFYENEGDANSLKQLQLLYEYEPFFEKMMFKSRFEELAEILLDDQVVGKNMQYFNKPPLIGQPTPPHQDGYYFMLSPNEAVTMWMALEPVDEENGCVRYVKGSHLKGLREHGKTKTLGFSQGIIDFGTEEDTKNEVWFPTQPGDMFVHHSLAIHRADGNNSANRTRKALGLIYYAQKAKEDVARKTAYQNKLKEEITNK